MPSATVNVGILGAGYISEWHLKALRQMAGVKVVAVADAHKKQAEKLARKYGVPKIFSSLEDMLARDKLDVVHVLTPPATHAKLVEHILMSGADAFVEKPLCVNQNEADRLLEVSRSTGRLLGIGHNFLFARPYTELKRDVMAGLLGRIESVDIVWAKSLPQFSTGMLREWMFKSSGNLILEIGPHSVAHLIDLVGVPGSFEVDTYSPVTSADGVSCFRNWEVTASCGKTRVLLRFSYRTGHPEHYISVRGSAASATADMEAGTYLRSASSLFSADLGKFFGTIGDATRLSRQAASTFVRTALSKVRVLPESSPYGGSIRLATEAFYAGRSGEIPFAVSGELGREVVCFCASVADRVNEANPVSAVPQVYEHNDKHLVPECLVIGGTGFIGKCIVRKLAERGTSVRVVTRSSKGIPACLRHPNVEVFEGDYGNEADLDRALAGIKDVIHLAKSNSTLWEEYVQGDLIPTELLARKCIEHEIRRVVYAGTIASLYTGGKAGTITEATPVDPKLKSRLHYGRVKGMCEQVLMEAYRQHGLSVTILRPGVVIGEGGPPLHWGIGMWQGENTCLTWGKGDNLLPIVLVEDCADAFIAALDAKGIEGRAFNIVGEPFLTAQDYLREMEVYSNTKLTVKQTPIWWFFLADFSKWLVKIAVSHPDRKMPSYRDWESRTNKAIFDCLSAREALNWAPELRREEVIRKGIHLPLDEFLG